MTGAAPAKAEELLRILADRGPLGSADLAVELGVGDRTVRRCLRRLIRDGYVFSPERGRYRTTGAGTAVVARRPAQRSWWEASPADLVDRWRNRR